MRNLILSGAAIAAISTGAWLFAGGEQCAQSAAACDAAKADKTSLVSTDGKTCETTAVKASSCSGDKTTLVSTDAKTCDATAAAKAGACSADKTSLVSSDGKSCETTTAAKTEAVKADGACCSDKADKTSLVSLEPAESAKAATALDTLKALAGKWKGESPHGTGEIEFKVSSAGATVLETMFPGTGHEMTNVYIMDGDDLLVTHYCAGGNAPRMKMTKNENGKMAFEYHDATNLPDRKMMHMGALEITIVGPDQIIEKWTNFKDGAPAGDMEFKLERVK